MAAEPMQVELSERSIEKLAVAIVREQNRHAHRATIAGRRSSTAATRERDALDQLLAIR